MYLTVKISETLTYISKISHGKGKHTMVECFIKNIAKKTRITTKPVIYKSTGCVWPNV